MEVKILVTADYADFSQPGKTNAQRLEAGTLIEYPAEYAQGLIDAGLAEAVTSKAVAQLIPEPPPSVRAEEPVIEPEQRKKGRR